MAPPQVSDAAIGEDKPIWGSGEAFDGNRNAEIPRLARLSYTLGLRT